MSAPDPTSDAARAQHVHEQTRANLDHLDATSRPQPRGGDSKEQQR